MTATILDGHATRAAISGAELLGVIDEPNADTACEGYLIQVPLPAPLDTAVPDVGITRTDDGLVGEVHPDVREVAGFLAPMPGGAGPMTIAMLVGNVVGAAERRLAAQQA
jgi:5,10-methylene-tetrahydrofolate dehydrogenase/methenyl tetrahydrofolate cyclohydrolase